MPTPVDPPARVATAVDQETLERLEFPRIRTLLCGLAGSWGGKDLLAGLVPFPDREEAERTRDLVDVLKQCSARGSGLPALEIQDLRSLLGALGAPGAVLDADALLRLLPLLRGAREAKRFLSGAREEHPELATLGDPLTPLPQLERALEETFEPGGDVRDGASTALRRIRRGRESLRERLRGRMERLAARLSGEDAGSLVTLREGRFVIAVPQTQKAKLEGLVLDRSASGSTFYMEPLAVVEENNGLREKDAEERAEIRRILAELTGRFAAERDALARDFEHLGYLDSLRARALLGGRWDAEPAAFSDGPELELRGARHPLLLEARSQAGQAREAVVPLTLSLGAEGRLLLITGPNMGGKTVALKCLGLVSILAQCGCLIPAEPGCRLPWVGSWVVSLGDEQSLEDDLSTFGAHLSRWAEALRVAGPEALILLDELGSGTDPSEGAALAQSVLERLVESGALGLVTTHLGTLKAFVAEAPGIRNASMVFDPQSRRPSYRLAVGLPGESHALEMARRLGFPEERVARAEALLPQEERDVRRLLGELNEEKRLLALHRAEAEKNLAEARRLQDERRGRLERFLEERASLRARAANQARAIVRRAEETLRRVDREMREEEKRGGTSRRSLVRRQESLSRLGAPRKRPARGRVPESVRPGERYWAEALEREVEVVREGEAGGRVQVLQNGVRIELPLSGLRVLEKNGPAPHERPTPPRIPPVRIPEVEASSEVNLRGLRVEEALAQLDQAIDRGLLAGMKHLRVIHGKGTGALRRAVTEHCHGHPGVASARIGELEEGGAGVTVIEMEA